MTHIQDDLKKTAEEAGFTTQDIATWLEYGFSTVHNWLSGNHTPMPVKQQHIAKRIRLLQTVLKFEDGGLPVPPGVTQYERKAYIERIKNRALKGLFGPGTAA